MALLSFANTPFRVELSFYSVIENLEKQAADGDGLEAMRAKLLLEEMAPFPEFKTGIKNPALLQEQEGLIRKLLVDYFPPRLTRNEIKAVSIPFTSVIFNHTERFLQILKDAGDDFEVNIRDFDDHQFYVFSCCIILNQYYGTQLDFGKPLFYDLPASNGVIKHYRILYNADFLQVLPTDTMVPLTEEDIVLLMNSYHDLDLWKRKFPQESWVFRGFTIMALIDATVENAVSIFKEKLLGLNTVGFQQSVESVFRSIYRVPDIRVGFTFFSEEDNTLRVDPFGQDFQSFILEESDHVKSAKALCLASYKTLVERREYFSVSDTAGFLAENHNSPLAARFLSRNIQSFILAPVMKNGVLMGVLEVVSDKPMVLNSINANKLKVVMPFLTDTVERLSAQLQNQVQAIIQEKFTAVHGSVYWRFREEAQSFIKEAQAGREYIFREIVFSDVFPLYGQIDIKGSSEVRNSSIQKDLQEQLKALLQLLEEVKKKEPELYVDEEVVRLKEDLLELAAPLKAATEQSVNLFLGRTVHPRLHQIRHRDLLPAIQQYFYNSFNKDGLFHTHRHKYESTISRINEKMAHIIDVRQIEAQHIFPHYYERFKTDGLEHNLYLGASVSPALPFQTEKLKALRLWQLRTLCEMELAHHAIKPALPYPLEVTSLILVYNTTIAIRFRMDEKRFDVDGSYNARFEIVKKRIDKAHIKNTAERITAEGKIVVVFSNDSEEMEYRNYIRMLQQENILGETELLELEDLQGVSGLKALRTQIIHPPV